MSTFPGCKSITFAASINAETDLIAAVTDKIINLRGAIMQSTVAGNVAIKDSASGTTIALIPCQANVVYDHEFGPGLRSLRGAAIRALLATATLNGTFWYSEEG